MKKEIKEKWIEALRSGEFKQGRGFLYNESNDSYCCLGVLGRVCGLQREKLDQMAFLYKYGMRYHPAARLRYDRDPTADDACPSQGYLSRMNDNGYSFSEIADWIEKNIPCEDS